MQTLSQKLITVMFDDSDDTVTVNLISNTIYL